jgi:hypothetical protein
MPVIANWQPSALLCQQLACRYDVCSKQKPAGVKQVFKIAIRGGRALTYPTVFAAFPE